MVAVSAVSLHVLVPLDVAEVGGALVVIVAVGADRQLGGTLPVDVVHGRLLADEAGAALCVALARLTVLHAVDTHTRLPARTTNTLSTRSAKKAGPQTHDRNSVKS